MTNAAPKTTPAQGITTKKLFAQAQSDIKAGRLIEAAAAYRGVVIADPTYFSAWMNLGTALRRLGHYDAAIAAGRRAHALDPTHSGCLTNLGNAYIDASRIDEAIECHRRARALAPEDTLVQRNLGVALREAGGFAEAYDIFVELEKTFPDDEKLAWEKALALLYQADFARGWPAFEARWRLPVMKDRFPHITRWRGEDIAGKKVLLTEEQGFGDTLLCSRFLPGVIAAAGPDGQVTLACKKPLHRLLSAIDGLRLITVEEAEAEAESAAGVPFDTQTAMMSLPGIFKADFDNLPPPPPMTYKVDLPPAIEQSLAAGKGRLRVGIIWSGSVTFANNKKRSVEADRFLPLMEMPGVEVYSLQKGPREQDLRPLGGTALIHEVAPLVNDFAETAAILKQLDLVIMTDSSVAHLAGSLGVPVWNLLHDRPYWLYLQDRADTPWYPSMTLYRQPKPGDWDSVFETVMGDVRRLAAQKSKAA